MRDFLFCWGTEIKNLFSDGYYLVMVIFSALLFGGAMSASWYLSEQNDLWNNAVPVGDFLFQIFPLWDLSVLFVLGALSIFLGGFIYILFVEPKKIPIALLAFALLVFFRGVLINATYIGIPVEHITPHTWGMEIFSFQNDLFFSGHTAGPFLAALLLWEKKIWRYFFLIASGVMACTVITMRLHYSIDVIGAYFITYGIYHFAEYLYHGERKWNKGIKNFMRKKGI